MVLLDNIELLTPLNFPVYFAAILKLIDQLDSPCCCCIAFCSSGSKISPALTTSSRLGKPHQLTKNEDVSKDLAPGLTVDKQNLDTFIGYTPFTRLIQEILPLFQSNQHRSLRPTGMSTMHLNDNVFYSYLFLSIGILICGPSGAGKTAMIRFFMKQLESSCKIFEVQCADLIHKVTIISKCFIESFTFSLSFFIQEVGSSEKNITKLFETGKHETLKRLLFLFTFVFSASKRPKYYNN